MAKWLLAVVLSLAFLLRVFGLPNFPSGFTPDEASFGYDAYSILKTGKDQWGKPFPLVLESFGDFKSPLYTYLTIPSVAAFGLNKFAVRLPNAVLGTLAVFITYLLTKKLFDREKYGEIAAFLLAISPWHIMLSRGAFEANLTTFFLPLAVLLFLNKKFALAGLIFGLNLFSYHSAKIVTPLVFLGTLVYAKHDYKKYWPTVATFAVLLLVNLYTFSLGAGARATERSITQGSLEAAFPERVRSLTIFHNKYFVVVDRFFANYITYFSPQFLFSDGPREGTYGMIPGRGVLFWFTIPFFLFLRSVYYKEQKFKREINFLFFWVFVAVIPAALATGVGYHANRVSAMMPALEIALAIGAAAFLSWLKDKKLLLFSFSFIAMIFFVFFLEDYFIQSPYKIGKNMLFGNLEAAEWVTQNTDLSQKVIVDKSLSEPHIYFAFAQKIDPVVFQKATSSWKYETWVDQIPEYNLERFTFKDISPDDLNKDVVLVGRPEDFVGGLEPTKTFYFPGGEPSIYAKIN